MTGQCSQSPSEDMAHLNLLMQLLSDRSKDALGPYVPGRGEFAPRWQAVAGLVKLGAAAVAPLCRALQDEDANTRRFAATALARIGDARAVAPLVVAFQTSELYVQRYVADALAALGDERAVEALYHALQTPDIAHNALLALQAILARTADTVSPDLLYQVTALSDNGHYVAEEPDTDGGYLSWNRVEHWLDCRLVKQLAQQALARRRLVNKINTDLLTQARAALAGRDGLYWIIGGAGSGKSTICQALATCFALPVYDMDAHIYGAYHSRFRAERHPVNRAWSGAQNGLAWLLDMSWTEFNQFNQAALAEYLDLLCEDLAGTDLNARLLIDGGIANPALLAQIIPPRQIVCLAAPQQSSAALWQQPGERSAMKAAIFQLPKPEDAWRTFLLFDERITQTILQECQAHGIAICARGDAETAAELAVRVAQILGLQ